MVFPDAESKSAKLFARAVQVMPGGMTRHPVWFPPYLVYASEGHGPRITDVDGVERLDFINNYSCQIHGHNHPLISRAICEQATRLTSAILPTEVELELAELLQDRVPGIDKVRFANTGTEAVMLALKIARAFTGRPKVLKMEGGYHGQYPELETSFVSHPGNWGPEERPNRNAFSEGTPQALLENVVIAPFNRIEITRALIREHAADLAAVIIDPMPSRLQFIKASPDYLAMLREETRRIGALLIFDEVFSFRMDHNGAQGALGVTPDLTCLGKIIGGGLPIGAVGGSDAVMSVLSTPGAGGLPKVFHGGTFTANPMSMIAGAVAMKLMTPAVYDDLAAKADRLRQGLRTVAAEAGLPLQVMGHGSLTGLGFCPAPFDSYREMIEMGGPGIRQTMFAFHRLMLNEGVIMSPQAIFVGSTPMTDADIDFTVAAAGRSFQALAQA